MENNTIGDRIKALRIDHDQTQEQLAIIMDCSVKQLRRYERNEQEMTISKLESLCQYYKVSADYILGLPHGLSWPRG